MTQTVADTETHPRPMRLILVAGSMSEREFYIVFLLVGFICHNRMIFNRPILFLKIFRECFEC